MSELFMVKKEDFVSENVEGGRTMQLEVFTTTEGGEPCHVHGGILYMGNARELVNITSREFPTAVRWELVGKERKKLLRWERPEGSKALPELRYGNEEDIPDFGI